VTGWTSEHRTTPRDRKTVETVLKNKNALLHLKSISVRHFRKTHFLVKPVDVIGKRFFRQAQWNVALLPVLLIPLGKSRWLQKPRMQSTDQPRIVQSSSECKET
jgi:hypothetical protein